MMGGDVGDLNLRHFLFFEASRPQNVEGGRYLVRALSWRDGPWAVERMIRIYVACKFKDHRKYNSGHVDFKSLVRLK